MRNFALDDSAWADFLISKAALILASVVLFAVLFHLVVGFKELEAQEQLDFLAHDFKTAVDRVGSDNSGSYNPGSGSSGLDRAESGSFGERSQQDSQVGSQDKFKESVYCFEEKEIFRNSRFARDIKVRVSGEYVCLEAEYDKQSFRAVRPFAFRVLPFSESVLHERLNAEFGAWGSEDSPLKTDYSKIETFLETIGTEGVTLNPDKDISLKKELIHVKDGEETFAFGCVLVYQ